MCLSGTKLLIEVKCRQFITHHNNRGMAAIELPSRADGLQELASHILKEGETMVLPRDNVVKDFLSSADSKFASFKQEDPTCLCVLVIVWDDFAYEPISSLLNEHSGLLTNKSFYKENGSVVKFNNIDAVLIVRHSHQLVRATRDEYPTEPLTHPLDWGKKDEVLPKALVPVAPLSIPTIQFLCDIFEAHPIDELNKLADYRPHSIIIRL